MKPLLLGTRRKSPPRRFGVPTGVQGQPRQLAGLTTSTCVSCPLAAASFGGTRLFLPFEGDSTLAVILSKAVLLARDKVITDPSIVRQIRSA